MKNIVILENVKFEDFHDKVRAYGELTGRHWTGIAVQVKGEFQRSQRQSGLPDRGLD